jgi:F1F0 ATPase subunit 2
MNEAVSLTLAFVAGVSLGAFFFGGLWWTVRKGVSSQRPAVWFMGSMLVRMGATLGGFYLVGRGRWDRLVVCLLGFLGARLVVTWLLRGSRESQARAAKEAGHATQC